MRWSRTFWLTAFAVMLQASAGAQNFQEFFPTPEPLPIPKPDEGLRWRLQAGDEMYEGNISYARRVDGGLVLHLVNGDAVNVQIRLTGSGGSQSVEHALMAVGRRQPCRLVASDPPFTVKFAADEPKTLSGTFTGLLACPDLSALRVNGAFRVPVEE